MRLPQDYILHIESAKDGVHITAEWQGELVRCKDCRHYEYGMVGYCWEVEKGVSEDFYCAYGERREP